LLAAGLTKPFSEGEFGGSGVDAGGCSVTSLITPSLILASDCRVDVSLGVVSGKSGGRGPVHPPSHKDLRLPSGPMVGENRRTHSQDFCHWRSARRARQEATL
jgi:hypothetical protein